MKNYDPNGKIVVELTLTSIAYIACVFICSVTILYFTEKAVTALLDLVSDQLTISSMNVTYSIEEETRAQIYEYAPHSKNKSEKNRNKHEGGDARRKRDQGGEKKKQNKTWIPNPNKRGGNKFYEIRIPKH